MMFMRQTFPEFRFGFFIHGVAFEAAFGWVGFMILWSKAKEIPGVLEGLPEMPDPGNGECQRCNSKDWAACNTDKAGFITACNKCPDHPKLNGPHFDYPQENAVNSAQRQESE